MGKVRYNLDQEPIVMSKGLLDTLLHQDRPADLIALYTFYYYTAKWQQTNQPKATTAYVAKGLRWSEEKVQSVKKPLLDLGLIEDITSKNDKGQITGHYIRVNFTWRRVRVRTLYNHTPENQGGGFSSPWKQPALANPGTNTLSTNNINSSNNNSKNPPPSAGGSEPSPGSNNPSGPIVPSQFGNFWDLYQTGLSPARGSRGDALRAWEKICSWHRSKRPTWGEIRNAVNAQKRSERWQDPKYIPHPSTWLNNYRWMDDPSQMKSWSKFDNGRRSKFYTPEGDRVLVGPNGSMAHCVVNKNEGVRYEPDYCIEND